jgi:hypothetical protein
MYSPKIKKELIPKIYTLAKEKGIKMTTLVNGILENVYTLLFITSEAE